MIKIQPNRKIASIALRDRFGEEEFGALKNRSELIKTVTELALRAGSLDNRATTLEELKAALGEMPKGEIQRCPESFEGAEQTPQATKLFGLITRHRHEDRKKLEDGSRPYRMTQSLVLLNNGIEGNERTPRAYRFTRETTRDKGRG